MRKAKEIISFVANQTSRVLLFHSGSGKDSIALLDMIAPRFSEVVCVYMYVVKDLEHINRYISWSTRKYGNVRFVQIPHYALFSYIKTGYLGHTCNRKQRLYDLDELTARVREQTGIEWAFYGFKQSDSLNRRLMLKGYKDEAINPTTKKAYPLSPYKNADVLQYIEAHDLITPEKYGANKQSSGCDVSDLEYLLYLKKNYPDDLEKVFASFPMSERILFEHENKV